MSKYLKQDTKLGFIEDNAEIEYTRFCDLRHTILGCMLGDYDANGIYVLSPEIKKELIAMPKYIVDSMENIDICASVLKLDKQITFMITYEGDRVVLSLMEKISFEANHKLNSGTYSNINEYILDEIESSGIVNKNAVYETWNISEYPGNALDVFNMDEETKALYFNTINRFKYLMAANRVLLENEPKLEEIESTYANRLFEILESYPKLKAKVEKEIKDTLSEKKDFIRLDKPNFAKTLNEVIEKAIDDNIAVLDEKEKESFEIEKHNAQMEVNILRREVVDVQTKPIELPLTEEDEKELEVVGVKTEDKKERTSEIVQLDVHGRDEFSLSDVTADFIDTNKKSEEQTRTAVVDIITGRTSSNNTENAQGTEPVAEESSRARKKAGNTQDQNAVPGSAVQNPPVSTSAREELLKRLTNNGILNSSDHVDKDTKNKVEEQTPVPVVEEQTAEEVVTPAPVVKEEGKTAVQSDGGGGGGSGGSSSASKKKTGATSQQQRGQTARQDTAAAAPAGRGNGQQGAQAGQGNKTKQGSASDPYNYTPLPFTPPPKPKQKEPAQEILGDQGQQIPSGDGVESDLLTKTRRRRGQTLELGETSVDSLNPGKAADKVDSLKKTRNKYNNTTTVRSIEWLNK